MKSAHGAEPVTLTCYCERHLPVCLVTFTWENFTNMKSRKSNKFYVLLL